MNFDNRLPLNFHQTFIPERRYLTNLITLMTENSFYSDSELSAVTGIPMGRHSGKLTATIDYARGMGLISGRSGSNRQLKLTALGKILIEEDPYINEQVSQLALHLGITRRNCGSDLWYQTFTSAPRVLGPRFKQSKLIAFLEGVFGKSNRSVLGPIFRTYLDPASLGLVDIIEISESEDPEILIKPVQLLEKYSELYAYILISIWESFADQLNQSQVTTDDLNEITSIQNQLNLNDRQFDLLLSMIQDTGAIYVDRQMSPWIIAKKFDSRQLVLHIYDSI